VNGNLTTMLHGMLRFMRIIHLQGDFDVTFKKILTYGLSIAACAISGTGSG
jgi:hypothetical protein